VQVPSGLQVANRPQGGEQSGGAPAVEPAEPPEPLELVAPVDPAEPLEPVELVEPGEPVEPPPLVPAQAAAITSSAHRDAVLPPSMARVNHLDGQAAISTR
jgi:hypothetical protein